MYRRLSTLFIAFCIALMQPLQALSQTQPPTAPQSLQWNGRGTWMMWGDGYGWQYWWICPLMMLFMIVVFGAIVVGVRRSWGNGSHHGEPPWQGSAQSAMQILGERFARGEIQKKEYEEKKVTILFGGPH